MDLRICFRVRERRDVDLILGQGMLNSGWDAHNLNAPGKFLVSTPEHQRPKRARAYLLTDQVVTDTAARYAGSRPALDQESQRAILAASTHRPVPESDSSESYDSPDTGTDTESTTARADETLWFALCMAPDEGVEIGELMRVTGMSRPTLYRRLAEHARAGRAVQVSRGRWRAITTEEPHGE
jgi:S-DNA-T family DNA segregation ATPase FtsK/SpoIIIE